MATNQSRMQLIWGGALLLMGVAMLLRIPQVMQQIETIELYRSASSYIRFCFYMISVMLIGGGGRKVLAQLRSNDEK